MTSGCDAMECVFAYSGISATEVWSRIADVGLRSNPTEILLAGENVSVGKLMQRLNRSREFGIETGGWAFDFGHVSSFDLCLLRLQSKNELSVSEWDSWARCFFHPSLISARIFNREYEYWQNAEDPLEYTAKRLEYKHLKVMLDEDGEERIDTSQNPGRRVLRDGFVEAVGPVMWLTTLFFERTGIPRAAVRESRSLTISPFESQSIRIQVTDRCFCAATGLERTLQDELRRTVFPGEDAN